MAKLLISAVLVAISVACVHADPASKFLSIVGSVGTGTAPAGASTRASYGQQCRTDVCEVLRAITCDENTAMCRCLDRNNIQVPGIGYYVDMEWNAGVGRCLAKRDTLCANDPLQIPDETGQIHSIAINCVSGTTCSYLQTVSGFRLGYCKANGNGGGNGAGVAVLSVPVLLAGVILKTMF